MSYVASSPDLIISDTQIPYHHPKALEFVYYVKKHYGVPDEQMYHVGDELDQNYASTYDWDPDHTDTPSQEFEKAVEEMKCWYAAFPLMKVAISNHMLRPKKKAKVSGIPSFLLKRYEDMIEAPDGWRWASEWKVWSKHPYRIIHGMGYSGRGGHINAAVDGGMSTIIGHLHSFAGVNHIKTMGRESKLWAMNVGCLIDPDHLIYNYAKYSRNKPTLGVGLVFNDGSTPVWLPIEL